MNTLRLLTMAALVAAISPVKGADVPGFGGTDYSIPVTSMKNARQASTLLQQYDFSCGSAALATLLTHHYGYPINEQAVFEEMYLRGDQEKIRREGFSLLDMKRFLATLGFEADGFQQPLEKLLEARIPAIVLINENGYHHFVVVKGIRGDRVLIGDPAKGTSAVSRAAFESHWKNGLLFVIHNRMEVAKFNLASDWRVAPRAPLSAGINHEGLSNITMPKMGPGEF
jgi:predicted double-glycine peptidase